ncbi:MAG: GNAT family N-acetyltransferase [Cytophagales bacterium]|nr:GNAT family N-acetyltransferase [Cytophagales bacterium]
MSIQITEADRTHAGVIASLLTQLGYTDSITAVEHRIEMHERPGYKIFVATDQTVVGFIAIMIYQNLHISGSIGRITAFCVDELQRGKGIGTQLLHHAETFLKAQNCSKIELTSNNRRTESHVYYRNHGYEQTNQHFVKRLD